SQFMDQTNPLGEMTHKRRLSALGPGGLSRERAGFEVRDVHYTHYGRLCPIETPEGPNIGLISSLCVFAKVNDLGFIETPYRKVENGKVDLSAEGLVYLSAEEEDGKTIAQADTPLKSNGEFATNRIKARLEADFPIASPEDISLMEVAPNQIASIAASLIPFLEHDDANRALMGSNMMRQSVPLLRAEAPIVGTGIERQVIHDSRVQVMAEGNGVVEYVDAREIHVRYDRTEEEEFVSFNDSLVVYPIIKFRKTNQNTCINLRPIVVKGERVEKGQCLTEGYSTQNGELAIGRNLKVAFMPWKGYNFEDAIVISERVVREDIMTSIHIDEHILEVRDTKRGLEEFTSDIPNVGEDAIKNLDEHGLIRIGASIKPGDILIGKITPKGESDPSPEEKLLRAIFGDKAGDVKDASLKARPSLYGTVIDKKLFTRTVKDRKAKANEKPIIEGYKAEYEASCKKIKDILIQKLFKLVEGKTSQGVKDYAGNVIIPKGSKFTQKSLNEIEDYTNVVTEKWTTDNSKNDLISVLLHNYCRKHKEIEGEYKRKEYALSVGDELPSGIMQLAKVYIAQKRKLKVGDKMAGRHGNKGIVSRIVRDEDMPFLADGSIVDIVLNPLGVPSRMNIGQIYETVLGWAGKELGINFATPIFDGASLDDITEYTRKAGVPDFGKTYLFDGGTGERFDQPATVGVIYMLKLGHLIDDKMHARSIGPYSLITQQPLGGKAQFGGQRFGEMEVWAIEAFGASNVLQEILTVKSDDVYGRARAYEAIVKGEPLPTPGLPESFNVLLHELRGLSLNIDFE
ncbi:MAG: DNA-directed RNA polymerase subunit beta, partial [Bacteroidales bacterium]|nr:DNA-directed RNA polymerase subunit beta [Bacteroidales bacterium]